MADKVIPGTEIVTEQIDSILALKAKYDEKQMAFIKGLINPDLTDTELLMFLSYASKIGFNPFTKEIIPVVYGKNTPDRRVNTIVTRDGKRSKGMEKVKNLTVNAIYTQKVMAEDGKTAIVLQVKPWEGTLWGATASCDRGDQHFEVTVPLSEYDSGRSVWASKKSTMIKKVAESQLLSMAVPETLGGVYDESEMADITPKIPVVQVDNPDQPADEAILKTIDVLGGETERQYTQQEAVDEVQRLNALKKKK
jgi:phage recombination protein Bet